MSSSLTHLHADHVNGVPRALELVDVGEIIIPDAVTDEDGMLDEIVSAAESHGTARGGLIPTSFSASGTLS